jgi:hypothetical protein
MAGVMDSCRPTLVAQVPKDEDRPGDGPRPGREPPDEPPPGDHGPDPDEPVIDESILRRLRLPAGRRGLASGFAGELRARIG